MTLGELIAGAAARTAITDPHGARRLTYAQLESVAERIGRRLTGAGVSPADTVALVAGNGPDLVSTFLGVLRTGAAVAPLNPSYTRQELERYLEDLRPAALLTIGDVGTAAGEAARALSVPVWPVSGPAPESIDVGAPGRPAAALPAPDPDAAALVLHTSGTTGRPKGVYLRHRNLAASVQTIADSYLLGEEDVSYCVMPLFHVHGLVASTFAALSRGGTVVIPSRFSASAFWSDVARRGVTWFSAVPTIHRTLLLRAEDAPDDAAATLRFARSCSSTLAPTLWQQFEERFGVPLVEAYGMTEASHQMTSNPLPPRDRRPGTVGIATGIELAVLDDDWRPLAAGTAGEVAVRGPSIVDEYRGNPEATAAAFRDGWFRTGDRGVLSDDGYLTLHGRIKELINRGGEKISPYEVEDALLSHPGVREAVAFAVSDDKYGEEVAAMVVPADAAPRDADDLRAHCSERLATFKVPKRIQFVETIPKGPTGKVQRNQMAERIAT